MQVNPHKFSCRTNDLNLVCLKYLGSTFFINSSLLWTLNATPEGLHETIEASPVISAFSSKSWSARGNNIFVSLSSLLSFFALDLVLPSAPSSILFSVAPELTFIALKSFFVVWFMVPQSSAYKGSS